MQENSSLFSLSIDPVSKLHLTDAAKWARFLAIVGFVFLGLLIVGGIFATITVNELENSVYRESRFRTTGLTSAFGFAAAFAYILAAIIWFFPLLYLLRFGNAMRTALAADDQERLNISFQNLKACFRYFGIITVIALVLFGLSFFFGLLASIR